MSGEMEAPNVYEDLQMEEKTKTVESKPVKKWVVAVAVVAVILCVFWGGLCRGVFRCTLSR